MRQVLTLLLLGFVLLNVCACGRMNAPTAPQGSVYRRTYY